MRGKKKLNLDRYVPGLITFIANKLSAGASQCYRDNFGIGVVEWRVLSMLAVESHIPAQRVCQVVGLDKSAVSRSLHVLREQGYVHSEIDSCDARRYTVSLTEEGQNLHDRILIVAQERERRLLQTLSSEEVDTLVRLLNQLHTSVEDVNAYRPGTISGCR